MKRHAVQAWLLCCFLIFLWVCYYLWGGDGLLVGNVFGGSVYMALSYLIDQRLGKCSKGLQHIPWWK
ncbi:MAG: hypothetical protein ACFHW5_09435 [Verrucomicrobiota bacterium]